jgi:hypothetical protein
MSQARIRTPLELPRLSRLKAPLAGRLKPADRWARLALVALLAAGFVLAAACGAAPRNVGALKPGAQPQPGTLAGEVGRGEPADAQHDAAGQTAQLSGIAPADKSAAPAAAAPRAAGNAGANASAAAPQQPLPPLPSIDRMIVKSGTLTRIEHDCEKETASAGQVMLESGHAHDKGMIIRNEGAQAAEAVIVYVVQKDSPLRVDMPAACS